MRQLATILICLLTTCICQAQDLQWSNTTGPYRTQVNVFASGPGNVLFAGTNSGLFKTTNGGQLWTAVASVPGLVYDIASNGSKIFVAGAGGMTMSIDSGLTWVVRDSGFSLFPLMYSVKSVNGTLYACMGSEGFFRSKDDGKYWEQLNSGGIENKSISSMIATSDALILAESQGVLRSVDSGLTWTEPVGDIMNQTIHSFAVVGAIIFAGTESGVYRSLDDGVTWSQSSTGMRQDDIVNSLAASADNKMLFAGTVDFNSEVGVYRSKDNGLSWQLVNSGLSDLAIYSLHAEQSLLYIGTGLGISTSTNNGDSWITASEGLPKPAIISLATPYSNMLAGSTGAYIFQTDDHGGHWMNSSKGLTRPNVTALLAVGSTVFAGTDGQPKIGKGGVHRSTDYGQTWSQLTNTIPIMSVSFLSLSGSKIIACGDSGIFSSTNEGNSWEEISSMVATAFFADNTTMYVATKDAVFQYSAGTGWLPVNFGNPSLQVRAITRRGQYLFVGTDSGIYRSSTGIGDFTLVTGDSLFIDCLWPNDHLIVAGTKHGIYVSSNDGDSWQYQESASAIQINAISGALRDIYAATPNGVIHGSLTGYGVSNGLSGISKSIHVSNSVLNIAVIQYSIVNAGDVSLAVYDMLGSERVNLLQGNREPGDYQLDWDSTPLSSGSYMFILSANGRKESAKFMVLH